MLQSTLMRIRDKLYDTVANPVTGTTSTLKSLSPASSTTSSSLEDARDKLVIAFQQCSTCNSALQSYKQWLLVQVRLIHSQESTIEQTALIESGLLLDFLLVTPCASCHEDSHQQQWALVRQSGLECEARILANSSYVFIVYPLIVFICYVFYLACLHLIHLCSDVCVKVFCCLSVTRCY